MRAHVFAFALLLCGCISMPVARPPPIVSAQQTHCVIYTNAQQSAFADAAAALDAAKPKGYRIIDGFLTDYHNMRVAQGCDQ